MTFTPTQDTVCFTLQPVDDVAIENTAVLQLTVSSIDTSVVSSNASALLTVLDNDGKTSSHSTVNPQNFIHDISVHHQVFCPENALQYHCVVFFSWFFYFHFSSYSRKLCGSMVLQDSFYWR